jgi:2-polyprenyl-6-methoxyphenol hydroxylase-like FAD-dependent oxidoreductase
VAEASRILIVGGGIAGLSAAIALGDAGYRAELVESRADWPVTGAAITMHANGVRALGRLGLASGLAGPVPSCRVPIRKSRGSPFSDISGHRGLTCRITLDVINAMRYAYIS